MRNIVKEFTAEPFDFKKILDSVEDLSLKHSAKEKLIVILGATSAGKSALALRLAEILGTEIISADSMSVYKNFDIGTAKPDKEELRLIRHHLIDILEPEEKFSVAEFVRRAKKIITDLNAEKKIPIIAGGTGLYIQALIEGYRFGESDETGNFSKSRESFFAQTGELVYDALVIGLTMRRAKLYERINERTKKMFAEGLIDEVKNLLNSGVKPDAQAMLGIGYKETIEYLRGGATLEEAIEKVSAATRNFAKRQMTWYRRMKYIKFFEVEEVL